MNWDILNLEENGDWEHLQILDRLHDEGVDCYFVDMWMDDVVIIIGYRSGYDKYEIAGALNIPEEVIYYDPEHCFVFINLYQLKAIRAGLDKQIQLFYKEYKQEVE